jgi:hypothetical protein
MAFVVASVQLAETTESFDSPASHRRATRVAASCRTSFLVAFDVYSCLHRR